MADDQLDRLTEVLVQKVTADRFPSITLMDTVELAMPADRLGDYLDALIDKIESERFPSLEMIRRVQRLAGVARQAAAG